MKSYKLANNILGWVTFIIAAVTYLMTIEPTASFWDCSEFTASAYKLEVGHPPGSPIFMLVANLFTQLTSDPTYKAMMVNCMSAIFSALTILFLFWTITYLARKIIVPIDSKSMSLSQMIGVLGCGLVGALAYTFSDTFWFSAVESEVYAFSSMMTALVIWLILKWEDVSDEPHADRWLILIAYMTGISIAVHLLNLLCIPAIVMVYYFKKYPNPNLKGSLIALFTSFVIVALVLYGLVQGLVKVAGWFELLFVNELGFSYNSGVTFYVILIVGLLCWGIWETMQEKIHASRMKIAFILAVALLGIPFLGNSPWLGILLIVGLTIYFFSAKKINPVALNSILIGLFVIFIGYSSYALIMIRSAANTPMDQNSPEDVFTLKSYLGREQYGEVPLFYGQTYLADPIGAKDGAPTWVQVAKNDPSEKDRYFKMRKTEYVYQDELSTIFPRMFSAEHADQYREWANVKGKRVSVLGHAGPKIVYMPTFFENLKFFFRYQVNYMYWRYFLWNFSGRQNDIQGKGEISKGNWITGIKFIDKFIAGPQDNMPDFIVNNKAHNTYFMLPLLLGILGIFFQIYSGKRGVQGFWIIFLLFFMTGLAIVVYLNQPPDQPRERDYAYAGSFYAFCIWIGLGVAGIIKFLNKYAKIPALPAAVAGAVICLLIPARMASQNWGDHSRANRYTTRDFGRNYLTTCEPNAVIFTMGDNDTFPLWYAQEVEGYRTDVRVCNLSYFQTDWYVDQMKRQAYESEPLPILWKKSEYIDGAGKCDYVRINPRDSKWSVSRAINYIKRSDTRAKQQGESSNEILASTLSIPIDSNKVIASGLVKPENGDWIEKELLLNFGVQKNENGEVISAGKQSLRKQDLMILDMFNNNTDWKRPFYFASTIGPDNYQAYGPYLRQDGIALRLVPFNTSEERRIDSDVMFDNLMHKYKYGNMEQPGMYIDETVGRMAKSFRRLFVELGNRLVEENKPEKAKEVMDYCLNVIPDYNIPLELTWRDSDIGEIYHKIGEDAKAAEIYDVLKNRALKELNWYSQLNQNEYMSVITEVARNIAAMTNYVLPFYKEVHPEIYEELSTELITYRSQLDQIYGRSISRKSGLNR
ncbi:membrane protein [Bacteroidia bacterium]|nr:membrane protein [Bacteroidia bacterium]